jgi:hypothetical protein
LVSTVAPPIVVVFRLPVVAAAGVLVPVLPLPPVEDVPDELHAARIAEAAAVVLVGLVQVQLDQDAADVFLDGAVGDEEPSCDAGVGASFGHQREHLALPAAERGERVLAPAGAHQLLDQRGVHD